VAVRRLIFMRHGQYDELALTRWGGPLTPLGRRQAKKTATALRKLEVARIWSSTLLRAKETASFVAARQPRAHVKRTNLLCEVIPTKLPRHIKLRIPIDATHIKDDKTRADRAYETLFRATKQDRTEIVVCHGNLIRYLVCRALGIAPKLWMRLDSTHCGLTEFRVLPKGTVRVVRYNDVGHLPHSIRTEGGEKKNLRNTRR
jgi:serine/threonine-protein phosphatase PGAM5